MAITTYAELQSSIADFLNRDDLASVTTSFISLAEADMQRRIRHWRMEERSTAELDTQYSAIPADFVEIIRFHVTDNGTNPLELISQSELLQLKARSRNTAGKPKFYAFTAGELEVYPTPDGTYNVELYYIASIPALSDSNTSNWLLERYPDAYLYGALVHSAPYLKDDARIQVWAALYQNAIDAINAESERSKYGGSGLRMKIRSLS
jgi:hypothetical protein